MPKKLLYFIFILMICAFFIAFNINNRCDISVMFYVFKDVPIVVSLLFAFLFGIVSTLPFIIVHTLKRPKKDKNPIDTSVPPGVSTVELKKERKWFFKKKEKKDSLEGE